MKIKKITVKKQSEKNSTSLELFDSEKISQKLEENQLSEENNTENNEVKNDESNSEEKTTENVENTTTSDDENQKIKTKMTEFLPIIIALLIVKKNRLKQKHQLKQKQ